MDNADNTLIISLSQDLGILTKTLHSFSSNCTQNEENIRSWLFPSKNYKFVDEIIAKNDFSSVSYTNYLELVVDRTYAVVRLVVEHLKGFLSFTEHKNIIAPKLITFGFSFELLCKYICILTATKAMENKTNPRRHAEKNTKSSQTDIISLNRCDSCASAISCMKNLMDCLQNNKDQRVANERQQLKYEIYDITQFGSMLRSTTCLEKSINLVFEKLHEKCRENEGLREENQRLKSEINSKLAAVGILEKEVNIFKDKYDKNSFQLVVLTDENKRLLITKYQNGLKINMLEEIIHNLNRCIKSYRKTLDNLLEEKRALHNQLKMVSEKQSTILELNAKLCKRISLIETDEEEMVNSFIQMQKNVDKIYKSVGKISKNCEMVQEKLNDNCGRLDEEYANNRHKFSDIQEKMIKFVADNKTGNTRKNEQVTAYKVQGNPVEDMSKQVEENRKTIERLQNENNKLEGLISRFTSKIKK